MSPRRIALVARKEVRHILRDPRTLYMALGIPIVMLLLFGYALTYDIENVKVIVVDRDRTPASRDLASAFERSDLFRVVGRPDDARGLEGIFRRGEARAALVIPRGYERDLERGREARVQLVADGTNANDASIALGYGAAVGQALTAEKLSGALAAMGAGGAARPPVRVASRNWFNPALRSQWYMVPGLVAVIMAMMTSMLMALTVAREWERGTMEQLLVTPVRALEIVLGKLFPYFAIGLVQLVLVAAAGVLLFEVPFEGSLGLLFASACLFLVAGLGQGLLVSVSFPSQQVAMQVSFLSSMLPALLLSGFVSPIAAMPDLVQKLTYLIPSRYYLVVLRGLFLKGVPLGAIRVEMAALLAFALGLMVLSVARFRTRLD